MTSGQQDGGLAGVRRSGVRSRAVLVVLASLSAALVIAFMLFSGSDDPEPVTQDEVAAAVRDGIENAQRQQQSQPPEAAAAYQAIAPSLVTITTGGSDGEQPGSGTGIGTGVMINAEGAVLTARHVIADVGAPVVDESSGRTVQAIEVTFADGSTSSAVVAREEPDKDLAVLTLQQPPQMIVPAVLGGGVAVGDAVYPVGNPFGLTSTLTAGVVSALERSVRTPDGTTLNGLIQFDAAVNPGSSGGPLVDRQGHVVGIVTGLANPTEQANFVGVGFAVPIANAGGADGGPQK